MIGGSFFCFVFRVLSSSFLTPAFITKRATNRILRLTSKTRLTSSGVESQERWQAKQDEARSVDNITTIQP
jgi:hypothetical protein